MSSTPSPPERPFSVCPQSGGRGPHPSNEDSNTHMHSREGELLGPQVVWEASTSGAGAPQPGQARTAQAVWDVVFGEISRRKVTAA